MPAARKSTTLSKAIELAERINVAPIDLAEALWKAEQRNPGCLQEIIADTGLGRRKAYYLLSIWDRFAQLGFPRGLLAEVGWTKLAIVAKYAGPGAEAGWLDLAQRMTAKSLMTRAKEGHIDDTQYRSMSLRLTPAQHKLLASVLLKFGATPIGKGLAHKEKALTKALRTLLK